MCNTWCIIEQSNTLKPGLCKLPKLKVHFEAFVYKTSFFKLPSPFKQENVRSQNHFFKGVHYNP